MIVSVEDFMVQRFSSFCLLNAVIIIEKLKCEAAIRLVELQCNITIRGL